MIRVLSISAFFTLLILFALNYFFPITDKIDKIEYSTIITDNKGEVIHTFLTGDEKWRMKTSLEEISPLLKKTIIEKEDRFFYYHAGVNPLSMMRAMFRNIVMMKRTSGASTITMQVARALERRPRSYTNKLIEIF